MSDAFEYFTIQGHTWWQVMRVVASLLAILLIIPAWWWIFQHRKDRDE